MKGFLSRQKHFRQKTIPDPGKIYKRNPKQKNLGGRSRIFRKSYKRIPNKISKFPSFQNFKNTCHFFIFYFCQDNPQKKLLLTKKSFIYRENPQKKLLLTKKSIFIFKSPGRPEKHMTPILAINFGHLPRIGFV